MLAGNHDDPCVNASTVNGSTYTCTCTCHCREGDPSTAECILFSDGNQTQLQLSQMFVDIREHLTNVRNISIILDNQRVGGIMSSELQLENLDLFNASLQFFAFKVKEETFAEQWQVTGTSELSDCLLTNLRTLRLNLNLRQGTDLSFINSCSKLESLDLSYNTYIGMRGLFMDANSPLKNLAAFTNLQNLSLNAVQVAGLSGHIDQFNIFELFNVSQNMTLPLKRLSLNNNAITRLDDGLSFVAPNLEYLSVRQNSIIKPQLSMPFLVDLLMLHDNIRVFDISCQLTKVTSDCSRRTEELMSRFQFMLNEKDSTDHTIKTLDNSTCPYKFILDVIPWYLNYCLSASSEHNNFADTCKVVITCYDEAGGIKDNQTKFYNFTECVTSAIAQSTGPLFRKTIDKLCTVVMPDFRRCLQQSYSSLTPFPIVFSPRLQQVYASEIGYFRYQTFDNFFFCVANNSLNVFDFGNNPIFATSVTPLVRGMENLRYLGMYGNRMLADFSTIDDTDGYQLGYLDYSQNTAHFKENTDLCRKLSIKVDCIWIT